MWNALLCPQTQTCPKGDGERSDWEISQIIHLY